MHAMSFAVAIGAVLAATPAAACLEVVTDKAKAHALEAADEVLRIEALTEEYLAVPGAQSLRIGVGTGRVVATLKGRALPGDVVSYRLVDGQGPGPTCPARRFARPGQTYQLYLKNVADWGPPVILLPVD